MRKSELRENHDIETPSFYTGKSVLMKLLDSWLDEPETRKIEIIPVRNDEFLTFVYRFSKESAKIE